MTYQIPAEGVTWSALFRTVEQNKEQFRIIDYSVSQTTLEQVREEEREGEGGREREGRERETETETEREGWIAKRKLSDIFHNTSI